MSLSNAPSTSNVSENWIAQFTADNKHCLEFDGANDKEVIKIMMKIQKLIMLLFLYFKVIMILGFTINMMQVTMKWWLMREIMY